MTYEVRKALDQCGHAKVTHYGSARFICEHLHEVANQLLHSNRRFMQEAHVECLHELYIQSAMQSSPDVIQLLIQYSWLCSILLTKFSCPLLFHVVLQFLICNQP